MKRLVLALLAILLVACGQSSPPKHDTAARQPSPTPSATAKPGPVELEVPAISLTSSIEQVGVDTTGAMDVPKQLQDVAWYAPGVVPGQPGDAVIDGHKDDDSGHHGVFWSLDRLKAGDEIDVVMTQGVEKFTVTQVRTVAYNADPASLGLFYVGGEPRLTLITCTGQVNAQRTAYLQRLVVDASLEA